MKKPQLLLAALLSTVSALLYGCGFTVMRYDYDLTAEVKLDAARKSGQTYPVVRISAIQPQPPRVWLIETERWRMRLGPSTGLSFGAVVENFSDKNLCFPLNQGLVAVGNDVLLPWPVTGAHILREGERSIAAVGKPLSSGKLVEPPTVCVEPGRWAEFSVYLHTEKLSGRDNLFAVSGSGSTDRSAGETKQLILVLPYIQDGETYRITLNMQVQKAFPTRVYY